MGNARAATDPTNSPSERGGGAHSFSLRSPFSFLSDAWAGIRAGRELRTASSNLTSPANWLLNAFGASTKSGATVSEATAFNVSAISACVNILAQSVAMLPLKVYRDTGKGPEEAREHPLHYLLKRKPGAGQTSYQWRAWLQACLCLGGNGYSRVFRNRYSEVERIEPLKSSDVHEILRDRSTGRVLYRLQGEPVLVEDFHVLHLRGLSTDGVFGRSPLADLRESAGLALTAQEFAARSFANGNRKPGIILGKDGMTQTKAQEFLAFWMANYAGAANAGKTPLVWGADWKDMGMSNQDAELLLTRKFEVEEIARVYRVPLTLLQSMEKSTSFGTGIAELNRGFVNHTLMPWLVNWEMELEDKLLSETEKKQGYFIKFNVAALMRGSPVEQAQKALIERQARLITINEYRREQERTDFPDNLGDNPREDFNGQGGGKDAQEAQASAAQERHQKVLDTIRALPRPEVHVAAPQVTFADGAIAVDARTTIADGAVQVAPAAVDARTMIADGAIRAETKIEPGAMQFNAPPPPAPPPPGRKVIERDASGRLTLTEEPLK